MKLERLIGILQILLNNERISAGKLAQICEVSRRTIYRDIDTLAKAGIPIISEPGPNGGISIMSGYKVDKKYFSIQELSTLFTALNNIPPTFSTKELTCITEKLKSLIPIQYKQQITTESEKIKIDFTKWDGVRNLYQADMIKEAINQQRILCFHYINNHLEKTQREVEAYQLLFKEGSWYLRGYCLLKKDFRIFKLSRMLQLTLTSHTFIANKTLPSLVEDNTPAENILNVILLIKKEIFTQLIDQFHIKNTREYDREHYHVEIAFLDTPISYTLLLSLGSRCECLSPQSVRNKLAKQIQDMAALY